MKDELRSESRSFRSLQDGNEKSRSALRTPVAKARANPRLNYASYHTVAVSSLQIYLTAHHTLSLEPCYLRLGAPTVFADRGQVPVIFQSPQRRQAVVRVGSLRIHHRDSDR